MTSISDPTPNNMERSRNDSSSSLSSNKRRNKKKKKKIVNLNQSTDENNITPWKSEAQQQAYSCKLLQAFRHVRIGAAQVSEPLRGRAVRETADRVLAVTAKGRTRWSRAILTSKLKIKFKKSNNRQRRGGVATTKRNYNYNKNKKARVSILRLKTKNLQRKTRVLGRLVPGCRKQSLPVVLEEASDYIAALEMQVKAMAALANLLSGAGVSHRQT